MRKEFSWRDYDKYEQWLQDVLETMVEDLKNKDKEIERLNKEKKELKDGWQEEVYSKNEVLNDWFECKRKINILHSIIEEVREDLYQVVKWCTENKHNEDTIERYLVVDYGTIVGKINEIRTKLDKENK